MRVRDWGDNRRRARVDERGLIVPYLKAFVLALLHGMRKNLCAFLVIAGRREFERQSSVAIEIDDFIARH